MSAPLVAAIWRTSERGLSTKGHVALGDFKRDGFVDI